MDDDDTSISSPESFEDLVDDTSISSPESFEDLVGDLGFLIMNLTLFVLTLAAVMYGVTSWCLVKKFRHYRNYVILCAIMEKLLETLLFGLYYDDLSYSILFEGFLSIYEYCEESFYCRFLISSYMLYVDFVKLFSLDICRRYLKSSLFAWGLRCVTVLLFEVYTDYYYDSDASETITMQILVFLTDVMLFIPVAINIVMYVRVLHCFSRVSEAVGSISVSNWRPLHIATLIFLLSNLIVLPYIIITHFDVQILTINVITELGDILNTIGLCLFFIMLKSNWELWRDFLDKRSRQTVARNEVRMSKCL